ncbi:MAG: glycolate oxidase subunit GlcE [Alphaproteobacteria bacterium]|nr:glycolate oxidase subunit GlcE [Alphaproteobacteria bacterium]
MKPKSLAELAEGVAGARAPFALQGAGSKRGLGRPVVAELLDLSAFNAVIAYEPEELILECGAAARLKDVQGLLNKQGQMLAFEPPDFSALFSSKHAGTLGGALMCNLAGPRRLKAGAARDHVLGATGVNGTGEIIKAGARVVKNVTGYDVPRLLAGSHGTLMALTSVIFKVMPRPETENTLLVPCGNEASAVALMAKALGSSCEVSAAAYVPGQGVALRLEGIDVSVAYRRAKLATLLEAESQVLEAKASASLWQAVRDVTALPCQPSDCIWRISVAPQHAPQVIAALRQQFAFTFIIDWGGGLIWLAHNENQDHAAAIRAAASPGHATLFRASEATRATAQVFQPLPPALAALTQRVKQAFDQKGQFNPGRMYPEL